MLILFKLVMKKFQEEVSKERPCLPCPPHQIQRGVFKVPPSFFGKENEVGVAKVEGKVMLEEKPSPKNIANEIPKE